MAVPGILTGIIAEAKIARKLSSHVLCSGSSPARASLLVDELVRRGEITALISFGIAGGLAPDLPPGTLIVGDSVIAPGERYLAKPAWTQTLASRLPGSCVGTVYGGEAVATTVATKRALFGSCAALAVDLESLVVARAASAAGLPFGVLRAIADPAEQSLPSAVLVGLKPSGEAAILPVLGALLHDPRQLPALIRVAGDTRRALEALLGCVAIVKAAQNLLDMS